MKRLPILVPKDTHDIPFNIALGSAIVAIPDPDSDGDMTIYYEGNLYNACNLHDIENRLIVAVGRLQDNYPTTAKAWLSANTLEKAFIVVGHFVGDIRGDWRIDIKDKETLNDWAAQYKKKAA